MNATDARDQAVCDYRQQLYERFNIPKINEDIFELKDLIDKMQAKMYMLENDADKVLYEAFQLCDHGSKGYLSHAEFVGFFRLFCANNLQISVTEKMAKQMLLAVDVSGDGQIQEEEICPSRAARLKSEVNESAAS